MTHEEANEKFQIFSIASYRTVRAISDEEIEAIPYLGFNFWLFGFGFYEENYDDFSSIFFTKPWIADRVKLIEKWTSLYCNFN